MGRLGFERVSEELAVGPGAVCSRGPCLPLGKYCSFRKLGPHFGSPHSEDHNTFRSILGPPIYGSSHMGVPELQSV